jgi:tRNA(Ile2) C34 agmatinyltransferase TiaS
VVVIVLSVLFLAVLTGLIALAAVKVENRVHAPRCPHCGRRVSGGECRHCAADASAARPGA